MLHKDFKKYDCAVVVKMFSFSSAVKRTDCMRTCDFRSISTVFQSYQDNRRVTMKGCVQWNQFTIGKNSASS